jgi:hypothetical protein
MKIPNALPAHLMTPQERRRALCAILALGLIRLHQRQRDSSQLSEVTGESSLHFPPEQSGSPDAKHRRTA